MVEEGKRKLQKSKRRIFYFSPNLGKFVGVAMSQYMWKMVSIFTFPHMSSDLQPAKPQKTATPH